jgi:TonB-dependent starch-binding outer membrane protein SusC
MRTRLYGPSRAEGASPPVRRWLAGLALLVLCAAAAPALEAQTGTIRGTVVASNTRQPLAGVQIYVLNTRLGTLTSAQGNFILLNVPVGRADVRAQLVGFGTTGQAVEVRDGETATVRFELAQTAVALDEVVVTGAGVATERRKLGNTVATIGAGALENKPITTFSEVIAGREPGVSALPGSGLTGEGASIRIRGTNSLSQSNEPIVYLNGVRIDRAGGRGILQAAGSGVGGRPSRLDDIDPTTIERVEILKGAAAATLYGSEASGGVIQIFTKRGSTGEPRWEVQIEQGASRYPAGRFEPNAGFVTTEADAQRVSQFFGSQVRPFEVFERDFLSPIFETGYTSSYSASVSGGSSAVTYFASGRYQFEDGPIGTLGGSAAASDVVRRAQGTVNLSIFPAEGLTLRVNAMYTQGENNTISNNNNIYAPVTLAMFGQPQRASCTTPRGRSEPTGDGACTGQGNPFGQATFSTVREALQRSWEQQSHNFAGSVGATYRLQDNIGLDASFGVNAVNQQDVLFTPFGWDVDGLTTFDRSGSRTVGDRNFRQVSMDTKASWDATLGQAMTSQLVVGMQGFIDRTEQPGGFGRDFPGPGFGVAEAGSYQETYENAQSIVNAGFFAQEQIGFRDWIFATVGGRYDYNSAFGESAGGAFYPKASLSVIPSSRSTWTGIGPVSTLRVRAAIGQAGMQPGAFDKLTTYTSLRTEFGPGVRPWNLGNEDLRPEVSTEWEVGTEIGILRDRVAFEGTYWNRTVNDALISRQFPVSGGFLRQQLDNIGRLEGQGLELGLRGQAVQGRNVTVNLFANAAYLWEQISDLGGAPALKLGGSYTRYRNFIKEGHAPGAFFGPKVRDIEFPIDLNNNCQPHTREELLAYFAQPRNVADALTNSPFRVLVQNGDPRPCSEGGDYLGLYLGKPTPDWSGSFGGDISFLQGFTLSTLFEYKAGNFQVHNLTYGFRQSHATVGGNLPGAVRARAIMANPASTPEQRLEAAREWVTKYVALSPYDGLNEVHDADFVRLREVALTYNVPVSFAQRMGARSLAVNLAGRNLALWTKYVGTDPEVNLFGRQTVGGLDDMAMGLDAFGLPLARRFTVTVRAGF